MASFFSLSGQDAVHDAMEVTVKNAVNATALPLDMTFNNGHVVAVACYPFLMIVSAVGNITVLVILLRRRKRGRSRINNMLLHLSIADLLVSAADHHLLTGGREVCRRHQIRVFFV